MQGKLKKKEDLHELRSGKQSPPLPVIKRSEVNQSPEIRQVHSEVKHTTSERNISGQPHQYLNSQTTTRYLSPNERTQLRKDQKLKKIVFTYSWVTKKDQAIEREVVGVAEHSSSKHIVSPHKPIVTSEAQVHPDNTIQKKQEQKRQSVVVVPVEKQELKKKPQSPRSPVVVKPQSPKVPKSPKQPVEEKPAAQDPLIGTTIVVKDNKEVEPVKVETDSKREIEPVNVEVVQVEQVLKKEEVEVKPVEVEKEEKKVIESVTVTLVPVEEERDLVESEVRPVVIDRKSEDIAPLNLEPYSRNNILLEGSGVRAEAHEMPAKEVNPVEVESEARRKIDPVNISVIPVEQVLTKSQIERVVEPVEAEPRSSREIEPVNVTVIPV